MPRPVSSSMRFLSLSSPEALGLTKEKKSEQADFFWVQAAVPTAAIPTTAIPTQSSRFMIFGQAGYPLKG